MAIQVSGHVRVAAGGSAAARPDPAAQSRPAAAPGFTLWCPAIPSTPTTPAIGSGSSPSRGTRTTSSTPRTCWPVRKPELDRAGGGCGCPPRWTLLAAGSMVPRIACAIAHAIRDIQADSASGRRPPGQPRRAPRAQAPSTPRTWQTGGSALSWPIAWPRTPVQRRRPTPPRWTRAGLTGAPRPRHGRDSRRLAHRSEQNAAAAQPPKADNTHSTASRTTAVRGSSGDTRQRPRHWCCPAEDQLRTGLPRVHSPGPFPRLLHSQDRGAGCAQRAAPRCGTALCMC